MTLQFVIPEGENPYQLLAWYLHGEMREFLKDGGRVIFYIPSDLPEGEMRFFNAEKMRDYFIKEADADKRSSIFIVRGYDNLKKLVDAMSKRYRITVVAITRGLIEYIAISKERSEANFRNGDEKKVWREYERVRLSLITELSELRAIKSDRTYLLWGFYYTGFQNGGKRGRRVFLSKIIYDMGEIVVVKPHKHRRKGIAVMHLNKR